MEFNFKCVECGGRLALPDEIDHFICMVCGGE